MEEFLRQVAPIATVALTIVVAVALGLFARWIASLHAEQERDRHKVAQQWNARVEPASNFSPATLHIPFGDKEARMWHSIRGKTSYENLSIPFPDSHLRLEVFPQVMQLGIEHLLSMQDLQIGSPEFDQAFVIRGNDLAVIKKHLTPQTQAALWELGRSSVIQSAGETSDQASADMFLDLHLSIASGTLCVTKLETPETVAELNGFIRRFEGLLVSLGYSAGSKRPQSVAKKVPWPEPTCLVCGEPSAGDIVYCATCKTPHHSKCWKGRGACWMYGCGQRRYTSGADEIT